MANWLKRGSTAEARADVDRKVRDVVEATLADIASDASAPMTGTSMIVDGGWTAD